MYFKWSDGAYTRVKPYSAAATLITMNHHVSHTSSVILDTNIATAELAGILINLTWLLRCKHPPRSAHVMCDNQYAIKACLKLCKPHPDHVPLLHAIEKTVDHLTDITKIIFHWIPGHTNNSFHSQVDRLATNCLQHSHAAPVSLSQLIQHNTDAFASGGARHP